MDALITDEQRALVNGRESLQNSEFDPASVVKLFTPNPSFTSFVGTVWVGLSYELRMVPIGGHGDAIDHGGFDRLFLMLYIEKYNDPPDGNGQQHVMPCSPTALAVVT